MSKMLALGRFGTLTGTRRPGTGRCGRIPICGRRTFSVAFAHMGAAEDDSMSRRYVLSAGLIASSLLLGPTGGAMAAPDSAYDFRVMHYEQERTLEEFRGQVTVIFNIASQSLRALYDKYREAGFNLIAFSCNQFGGQAPETSDGERQIAFKKFGFEFPIFDKIMVNGKDAHPLYTFLKQQTKTGDIEWNYVKFLVDRNGRPVKRFGSLYDPIDFEDDVRLLLAGKETLSPECKRHPGRKACKVDAMLAA